MTRPAVVLIGAEFEENLSIRYLSAAVQREGFETHLLAFNDPRDVPSIVRRAREIAPVIVGISVPFQTRARELLELSGRLKDEGVAAPVVVGGHFATFEFRDILLDFPGIDVVVRHEGEATFTDLCHLAAIEHASSGKRNQFAGVAGTVVRDADGDVVDGGTRALPPLDELPFPDRSGDPHTVMGVRCSPIVGSRGCYADCSFCCIYAYAKNADGARYRMRSPESMVAEMQQEYTQRGVRLFIFHDDNFFVPSEEKNLARYQRMKALMEIAGMGDVALVIKCRPNDVTPDLFRLLQSMGLIRAYVGIETNSDEGIVSLNRRISPEDNRRALDIFDSLGVYRSFNVLIFDPEATMDGIRRNLDFLEAYADTPFNFCRAEVYAGTPLKTILERQGRLEGHYLAWSYEMNDPRVEVLFRIATTAFGSRNFKHDGVHNLNLGIRFDNEVMRHFHPMCWDEAWHGGLVGLSRRIGLDSVHFMREAHDFVSSVSPTAGNAVKRFTLDLARRVARSDLEFVGEIKAQRREMERRIRSRTGRSVPASGTDGAMPVWAAETARLSSSVGRGLSTEVLPPPSRTGRA